MHLNIVLWKVNCNYFYRTSSTCLSSYCRSIHGIKVDFSFCLVYPEQRARRVYSGRIITTGVGATKIRSQLISIRLPGVTSGLTFSDIEFRTDNSDFIFS